jgi:hypothetical protein
MGTLTLFTTCKPFAGVAAVHQRNALTSWTLMDPRPEVIVFGDEEGVAEETERLGLLHVSYAERDEHGLPFLDFIFKRAQWLASNDLLCYANADIVAVDRLAWAAARCARAFPGGFLGVCRRWDVEFNEALDFGADWRGRLRGLVKDRGELYSPCSSDIFLFKRPLGWEMLPFVAGRGRWDNWTLYEAARTGTPVVDVTPSVLLAHPKHPGSGNERKNLDRDGAGQGNARLAAGNLFCLKHVSQAGMLWRLTPDGLEKA